MQLRVFLVYMLHVSASRVDHDRYFVHPIWEVSSSEVLATYSTNRTDNPSICALVLKPLKTGVDLQLAPSSYARERTHIQTMQGRQTVYVMSSSQARMRESSPARTSDVIESRQMIVIEHTNCARIDSQEASSFDTR